MDTGPLALGPGLEPTPIDGDDRQFGGDGRVGDQTAALEVVDLLIACLPQLFAYVVGDASDLTITDGDFRQIGDGFGGLAERTGPSGCPEDLTEDRRRAVV